jgi:2-dehydro-3-deoxy-D-gluconate 5-dehydrogenase
MTDWFSLKGKVAMVTGAAQGIGREIALGFAQYGADIVAVDLNDEKLKSLKREIEAQHRRCMVLKVDLNQIAQIEQTVERSVKEMGRIDILANIAGVNVHKAAEEMTEKDWDFVLDINLKALFFCCQAVGKVMLKQGSGKIINMSSSFGMVGFGGRTAYASSKAAVSNLTKTLALEWSSRGIHVNAIAPGPVWTEARHELFSNPEFHANLVKKVPMNRTAKPAEIVGPAIFLASNASSFVTGETLLVDGGFCAQ